ncbi:MAG TPA: aminoacetone oxidase family FAD-binding enzyme [Myxococcota bacterium]|nr:aminoacetone oxidase family FAD-binding enzyme [Myxococcota bacterium]
MKGIGVIGGGAAGMMAALSAARAGAEVTILEHAPAGGAKLLLTGGGRCNFSHDCPARDFVRILGPSGRFMGHALAALDPASTRTLFERIGVPSRVEPDGRVVPMSQRAVDVRRALFDELARAGVNFITSFDVRTLRPDGHVWTAVSRDREISFSAVVLATGGMSYPATGSDGSGYAIARALGHKVVQPLPAEVPLVTTGIELTRLQGLTIENVEVSIAGSKSPPRRGNLLFTHFGVSGPVILDVSGDVAGMLAGGREVTLHVDLLPDLGDDAAARALAGGFATLRRLIPSRLAGVVDEAVSRLPASSQVTAIRKFPIRVTRTRGFECAMVTRGGVDLREADPSSMQSKLAAGLFFAGEILNLDGPMGGFNLQIAWSTGFLAGKAAARFSDQPRSV